MPELPDVQVFKQYMDATALHKKIERASVRGGTDDCPKCGGSLRSEKVSGRTTYYCARHQRRRR